MKYIFLFISICAFLFSNEVPLKGLILKGEKTAVESKVRENINTVQIFDVDIPGPVNHLKGDLIAKYFGKPISSELIVEIKREIAEYFEMENRPVVAVKVPEQDISCGIVELSVLEGTVGNICVRGNCNFKSDLFLNAISLCSGDCIDCEKVVNDLLWLNRNPFRRVDVLYTPGTSKYTTDIELLVQEIKTWRIYSGIDNTGNSITKNNRFFAGFNIGNLFWIDQRFSYQFTGALDNFKRFWAHTIDYTVPLPWKHTLEIYGGYSHVDTGFDVPNAAGPPFSSTGFALQGSLRYQIGLPTFRNVLNEVFFGFDFKRTNNNIEFSAFPVISGYVNLFQLMFGYNIGYESKSITTSWEIEGFVSPGQWFSDQSKSDYRRLRPKANPTYFYARSSCAFIWRMLKWIDTHQYFRGQVANANLLPSEEYGLGGYNTVRGYPERIVNGDYAFVYNGELRTKEVSVAKLFGKKWVDRLQLLGFVDYGISTKNQISLGETKTFHLLSMGPGIRYNILPYVTFRSDYGFQLKTLGGTIPHQRLHFSLVVGY